MRALVLAFCVLAAAACSESSPDAPPAPVSPNPPPAPPPPTPPTGSPPVATLDGLAFKGPAQCTVSVVDPAGAAIGGAAVTSDAAGAFQVTVADYEGVAFVEATDCSFVNETTNATQVGARFVAGVVIPALEADQTFAVNVTPFTAAAVANAEAGAGGRAGVTPALMQAANDAVSQSLGVADLSILETRPALATEASATASPEARAYGVLLAAIAGAGDLPSVIDLLADGLGADAPAGAREAAFDALLSGAVAFEASGRNQSGASAVEAVAAVGSGTAPSGAAPAVAAASDFLIGTNAGSAFAADLNALELFDDPDTGALTFRVFDLPPGVSFDGAAGLTGTPTVAGAYDVTIIALDGTGNAAVFTAPFNVLALPTAQEAARFLMASSFGPTLSDIETMSGSGFADWFEAQANTPMRSILGASEQRIPSAVNFGGEDNFALEEWYANAVDGPDQLRQRAAFALSQIFVVSAASGRISRYGHGFANYMDILQEGAFGNFRDLLEDVTYSPLMGIYLTYIGNEKADPANDTAPDENYAREILQLFSIGLTELNPDGTMQLDGNGQPVETYDNEDITELAKVFTGLWWNGLDFGRFQNQVTPAIETARMSATDSAHSTGAKTFLGRTVQAGGSTDQDISAALDIIFEHPNVAPFISRQLIQRMTTSNPSPAYVARVGAAFEAGRYRLPNGTVIGGGRRGDLAPVWAAILFDDEALPGLSGEAPTTYGKVREPIVRLVHWLRVADVDRIDLTSDGPRAGGLRTAERADNLSQSPFHSPSVFNYYRPGYVAPGSETADAGLVAPELQITNTTTTIGYQNFMRTRVFRDNSANGLNGGYEAELALAEDAAALTDHLDLVFTGGRMREENKQRIRDVIESVSFNDGNRDVRLRNRVQLAVQLAVSTPAFIVQN